MKKITTILAVICMSALFASCGEEDNGEAPVPSVGADFTNTAVMNFDGEYEEETEMQHPVAFITMKSGEVIKAELFPEKAPETVNNFIYLANDKKFYDGLIFHRVIQDFMIQGGCPEGTGRGGPGYNIKGEFAANGYTQNNIAHVKGILSMARMQFPYDSAGSQFFICVEDCPHLNGQYAAFGMVIDGMDTVDKISMTPTGASDKPKQPQTIESIRVDTRGVDYPRPKGAE